MPAHALVLGGTGSLWLAALHLARTGWSVTVTGRDPAHLPPSAAEFGIRFAAVDRDDAAATARLVRDGVDLLVDGQGYHPHQARGLAELSRRCGGTAYLSARAVYVDARGHHLNSPAGIDLPGPVPESTPTMGWSGQEVRSAAGYGAGKAESERVLLERGERVSVLRPSKIHGPWVRQLRTPPVLDLVAPGPRVLNVADADPRGMACCRRLSVPRVVAAPSGTAGSSSLRESVALPWRVPMVLDTAAVSDLGVALPTFAETAWMEVEWVLRQRGRA